MAADSLITLYNTEFCLPKIKEEIGMEELLNVVNPNDGLD